MAAQAICCGLLLFGHSGALRGPLRHFPWAPLHSTCPRMIPLTCLPALLGFVFRQLYYRDTQLLSCLAGCSRCVLKLISVFTDSLPLPCRPSTSSINNRKYSPVHLQAMVQRCSAAGPHAIRHLAARALAPLIEPGQLSFMLLRLVRRLPGPDSPITSHNEVRAVPGSPVVLAITWI